MLTKLCLHRRNRGLFSRTVIQTRPRLNFEQKMGLGCRKPHVCVPSLAFAKPFGRPTILPGISLAGLYVVFPCRHAICAEGRAEDSGHASQSCWCPLAQTRFHCCLLVTRTTDTNKRPHVVPGSKSCYGTKPPCGPLFRRSTSEIFEFPDVG